MKTTLLLTPLLLSPMAFAKPYLPATTLNCKIEVGGKKYDYLKISYKSNLQIDELKIENYQLIKDGVTLKDSEIGRSVFGVSISPLAASDDGTVQIEASLHDYSAEASWKVVLNPETREAGVVTTYQSSDGDDLLHTGTQSLKCE